MAHATFFLPWPHNTSRRLYFSLGSPLFWLLFCISCYGWWFLFVCSWCICWCVLLLFFIWDCCWLLLSHIHFIYSGVFVFSLGDPRQPTYAHLANFQGFCPDAHRFTLKCWWVVGGVGWTTFRDFPYASDFMVIHVRAIICCLLILFLTQSGSCTRRPLRLLICCFSLHRRLITSDITSSPHSSTATKPKASKGLLVAWRLDKSACNSAN